MKKFKIPYLLVGLSFLVSAIAYLLLSRDIYTNNFSYILKAIGLSPEFISSPIVLALLIPLMSVIATLIYSFYYNYPQFYGFPFYLGSKAKNKSVDVLRKELYLSLVANPIINIIIIVCLYTVDISVYKTNALMWFLVVALSPIFLVSYYYSIKSQLTRAQEIKSKA